MSDEPKKQSRAWLEWMLLALFVAYPISAGPAWWAAEHAQGWGWDNRGCGWAVFNAVYDPLYSTISNTTLLDALRRYVRCFQSDPPETLSLRIAEALTPAPRQRAFDAREIRGRDRPASMSTGEGWSAISR
jgi:hypothetical protein